MQQGQGSFFNPDPNTFYKVVSVLDAKKVFTAAPGQSLTITDYTGANSQKFHIYLNNGKYAFVAADNTALHVINDNQGDGGEIKLDAGQHKSSFFEISPVSNGQWAGKACHIRTFSQGKALDIYGGAAISGTKVVQWGFHGQGNQTWSVVPADAPQQVQPGQQPQQPAQQQGQPAQQQGQTQEVPAQFTPVANTDYRIVSVLDKNKAFTIVANQNKLTISDYKGDATQKFKIFQNGNKVAFVVQSNNQGLCVFHDKKESGGEVLTDGGQHASSWFTVVKNTQGTHANKGYVIKTHADNQALDINGGTANNGTPIIQWETHYGGNQTWLIIPASDPLPQQQPQQPQVPQVPQPPQPQPPQTQQQGFFPGYNPTGFGNIIQTWGQQGQGQQGQQGGWNAQGQPGTQQGGWNAPGQQAQGWGKPGWGGQTQQAQGWGKPGWGGQGHQAHGWGQQGQQAQGWGQQGQQAQGWGQQGQQGQQAQGWGQQGQQGWGQQGQQGQGWGGQSAGQGQGWGQGSHKGPVGDQKEGHFIANAKYSILSAGLQTKALTVSYDGFLTITDYNGAPNQLFTFKLDDGKYKIRSVANGKVMAVANDGLFAGSKISFDNEGRQSEKWSIDVNNKPEFSHFGNNVFTIRSWTFHTLDIPGANYANDVKIEMHGHNGNANQTWVIKQV